MNTLMIWGRLKPGTLQSHGDYVTFTLVVALPGKRRFIQHVTYPNPALVEVIEQTGGSRPLMVMGDLDEDDMLHARHIGIDLLEGQQ